MYFPFLVSAKCGENFDQKRAFITADYMSQDYRLDEAATVISPGGVVVASKQPGEAILTPAN